MSAKEERRIRNIDKRSMGERIEIPVDEFFLTATNDLALFVSPGGVAYISLPAGRATRHVPIRSAEARDYLHNLHYDHASQPPPPAALRRIIAHLEARARSASFQLRVSHRLATTGFEIDAITTEPLSIAVHHGPRTDRVITITARDIDFNTEPLIRFRCTRDQLPLPEPLAPEPGHDPLAQLRNLLRLDPPLTNIDDTDTGPADESNLSYSTTNSQTNQDPDGNRNYHRCLAFLLSAFLHRGARPVLLIRGPKQSGKTTLARLLRSLIDPTSAPFATPTASERRLAQLAWDNRILAFDDIGRPRRDFQHALRRVTSGITYTEKVPGDPLGPSSEEIARPVILTQDSSDPIPFHLADRALIVDLPELAPEDRRDEDDLLDTYNRLRPHVLHVLYAALHTLLARYPDTKLPPTERFPALARWTTAAAPALNLTEADIHRALAHDPHPAAEAIIRFLSTRDTWQGTASQLKAHLPGFPIATTANHFTRWLHQAEPDLRRAGIELTHCKEGKKSTRLIKLKKPRTDRRPSPAPLHQPPPTRPADPQITTPRPTAPPQIRSQDAEL